jgi:hypothetical protein
VSQRTEWGLIALLTLIMIVKGVLWSLAFPLWQGPDEDDHYAVIQFIAETSRLPDEADTYLPDEVALSRALADVGRIPYAPEQRQGFSQTAVGPNEAAFAQLPTPTRASFEQQAVGKLMHATPLYYLLAAPVYRLFDQGDLLYRVQVQRLLAVLVGAPLVVVAYLITRLLFPADPAMRLTIPTLVAFHPMITEITAVVSVDGLLILCYSLLIYLSLRVLRDGFTWRMGLLIGLTFAVGLLTKPTLNGYAPLIALLVVYDGWRRKRGNSRRSSLTDRREHGQKEGKETSVILSVREKISSWYDKELFVSTAVMGLTIIIPAVWWMQRSYRINKGDLFYFNPVVEGHRIVHNPYYDYPFFTHMLDYYQSIWGGLFTTWWAHFGWIDTALPPWTYTLLRLLTFLAMGGLLLKLVRAYRSGRLHFSTFFPWLFLAVSLLLPIVLLQYYDLSFWHTYGLGRGLQGRYWLGTVVPMLLFFVVGLLAWLPPRWHTAAHTTLRLGIVLLNFVSLLGYILPRYYL